MSASAEYQRLSRKRDEVLRRARSCAELTIPALMPPEGHTEGAELLTPHQGFGARGVNNLASKLLLALMPPNQTFYKFQVDDDVRKELEAADEQSDTDAMAAVEKQLSQIEQRILEHIEASSDRTTMYEAIRHLIVTGNGMIYMPNKGGMAFYRLDQYVVERDKMGQVLQGIIKETRDRSTVSERIEALIDTEPTADGHEEVDIYTWFKFEADDDDGTDGQWKVHQEVNDKKVPKSDGTYPKDSPAFIPLRWSSVANEDYGRSLVYEHIGDIRTLEGLSQSTNEFAANASKIIWLVNPGGVTDFAEINEAESGEAVSGREQDIASLGLDKTVDFRIVESRMATIESRLQQSFLLTASVQRDAERVTATEIRLMARELEDALGGVYSVLSQEFQTPYINRKLAQLQDRQAIPDFPKDTVKPRVTTGLEALGRGHDLNKLSAFLGDLANLPQGVAQQVIATIDTRNLMNRLATAHGLDTHGLIKSRQEVASEQQQGMMQQLTQDAGPGIAQEVVRQAGQSQQQQSTNG